MAYSTNLHVSFGQALFDDQGNCVGTSYGSEPMSFDSDGSKLPAEPTQTAKDNALLWSKAPEMLEIIKEIASPGINHGKAKALLAQLHFDCGPLCPEHGDARDTSVVKEG